MKKLLLAFLLLANPARAEDFAAGPHVTIHLSPAGEFRLELRGKPWTQQPTMATYMPLPGSWGRGSIKFTRITDLSSLTPGRLPGKSVQGLTSSREEKMACAWISSGPEGGCLVLDDIKRAHWENANNLSISPTQNPVVASVWLSKADLKVLEKAVYKAMDAKREQPKFQK